MGEGDFEGENNTGRDPSTPLVLRKQFFWSSPLVGGTGEMFGNKYIWPFASGWQSNVATVGATQYMIGSNFMASYPWQSLVPDQSHTVMTAGYGTYASTGSATITNNDYAVSASTPDGKLVIAYLPTVRTVSIDMSKLSGSTVTARWFDPTNGAYTPIAGSPFANSGTRQFTPSGNNSGGSPDWVLVLAA
jgi:hypothetical protein